ncbi:hypothetical protein F2Q68_00031546 [Brassica cretica]|uniref:alpha,alpha-trehalose-phosphate synthase (UDP-forming) n=1 Tax=Brassica cretica TaxID=69181 RepID=A0A8S9G362_BRACR|nr:hypothetical protein F2Q68_00031546 [Brassica cretica]
MGSKSFGNFLDLASGDLLDIPHTPRALPRVMTVPGIIDGYGISDRDSDAISLPCRERKIVVANFLPLNCKKDLETGQWIFSLDNDSPMLHLKDGFSPETEVIYVGSLKIDVDLSEQDEVSQTLFEEFGCVPTFLPQDVHKKFYLGFCKQQLWPLFHYMLPMCPDHGERFDRSLWQAYVSANKIFADKVMGAINLEEDCIWNHDYHLMLLPTFLRRRFYRVKLGFFLHSPFPSSEIYRTLPVREELLRGLLNCDLIGFHTFDYARHFLSCCCRMLGLEYESKRGHIALDYLGRTVFLKILPIGVQMGRLESVLNLPATAEKLKEIQEKYQGKKVILGVDDMDIFKGLSLKILAFEHLLQQYPSMLGKIVLIQIVNPARGSGKDVQEAKKETYYTVNRINERYGSPGYEPVVLIDRPVPRFEKSAYYAMAECCIVNAVRDGMNLVPYKYTVCRQGTPEMDKYMGLSDDSPPRTSTLVLSEFIGCSPSLSGAVRVNPWDVDAVADSMYSALTMPDSEKQLRHKKHYQYISTHDVAYWSRSFAQDLERACRDHYSKRCWGVGWGLGFRLIALSPNFRRLSVEQTVSAYRRSSKRAIFLDYDGTLVPETSIVKEPSADVMSAFKALCNDPNNTVFIVSGRGKVSLSDWLAPCPLLYWWNESCDWETSGFSNDFEWKKIVEPIMRLYTETTDGSTIEAKESALVWHHQDADRDFGSCQAKELLDHLESVLVNEPVVVNRGHQIVEVKPQGVSKGLVTGKVLRRMLEEGNAPDFVVCIGDDRSDEEMFESITTTLSAQPSSEIFACTVGRKPSKAKYFLDEVSDVVKLLQGLANTSSSPKPSYPYHLGVSFESLV